MTDPDDRPRPASYAIVLSRHPRTIRSILMILDSEEEAREIAIELRRRGQKVEVVKVSDLPSEWA